ncbi:hypothetical protein BB8028_0002g02930 [Beauveria bassiana]|uniref:Uncharacterized protein n=1 Tax=Beauveria bassiana TaxID=176275 RepID=A0A2S7Y1P9_BEABA|nr:hypothetical protein BB8028_0002g02930 [Beauveria bassiana]
MKLYETFFPTRTFFFYLSKLQRADFLQSYSPPLIIQGTRTHRGEKKIGPRKLLVLQATPPAKKITHLFTLLLNKENTAKAKKKKKKKKRKEKKECFADLPPHSPLLPRTLPPTKTVALVKPCSPRSKPGQRLRRRQQRRVLERVRRLPPQHLALATLPPPLEEERLRGP